MRKRDLFALPLCGVYAAALVSVYVGLSTVAQSQSPQPVSSVISSVIVPPTSERSVMFTDRGKTFLVGLNSGRVTVVDGSAPAPGPGPGPVIPPYTPPAPVLTGLSKVVADSLMASPIDAQNRVLGAKALISAIDSTVSEVGGLGVQDLQTVVNKLAVNAEAAQVNTLLKGWKLGDLLSTANITTMEQLLKALEDIKTGLSAIR